MRVAMTELPTRGARVDMRFRITACLVCCAGVVSCTPKSDNVGEVENTSGPTSTDTTDTTSTSSAEPTTTGPIDDETFCMQLTDPMQCAAAAAPQTGFPCAWETFTPVTVQDGACVVDEPVSMCVVLTGFTTAAGCAPQPWCPDVPFYRFVDGVALIGFYCGGSPPEGWSECETADPQLADPFECSCLCDFPGETTSDTTGGGTDTTSSTGTTGG